ncbi:MAG: septum formation inhibitor Maf [Methylococcales bacterium]|nr:septum formation inhibitor Maf [Methylococcales bacterium]
MKSSPTLILASQSPRRRELLTRLGLEFRVQSAEIDETQLAGESPVEMTERLARAKAQAIADSLLTPSWVMGADTTVTLDGIVFGKPASRQVAIDTLTQLADNTHQVISSVSLIGETFEKTTSVISNVRFGPLSRQTIAAYCDTYEPYDKAGSYGIQGLAGAFVEHIEGDYSAIVGLLLWATAQLLREAKIIQ